jgi:hypothetical protein
MESYKTIEAFFIIILIIAFADFISQRTKGYISMLLTATVIFTFLFSTGLDKQLFQLASFTQTGRAIAISLILVHLGTTLNIRTIIEQWKTVVIALSVQAGIIVFMFLIIPFVFDRLTALISIPPCGGGIVSVIITQQALSAKGLDSLTVYVLLVLVVNCFIGYPLASFMLKKEGMRILKDLHVETDGLKTSVIPVVKAACPFKPFVKFFDKYKSTEIFLAKTALIAFIAYIISRLSNFSVTPYILCFFIGYIAKEIGFLEPDVLKKANSFGFLTLVNIVVIFSVLTLTDMSILGTFWLPILAVNIVALFAMILVSLIVGRFLGISKHMSIATGIACMFGFPGTYVIPGEVAKSITKNEEEYDFVFNSLYPRMLISGFVNVTILSVLIAGILIKFI